MWAFRHDCAEDEEIVADAHFTYDGAGKAGWCATWESYASVTCTCIEQIGLIESYGGASHHQ
jgi:hypothetical protein